MKPQDVLKHPTAVLTEAQRRQFFDRGFLVLPDYVPERWLLCLRAAMAELLERSRSIRESDSVYIREEEHTQLRGQDQGQGPRLADRRQDQEHH